MFLERHVTGREKLVYVVATGMIEENAAGEKVAKGVK